MVSRGTACGVLLFGWHRHYFLPPRIGRFRRICTMRRLVGFLVFLAIVIVAVGFWRGWFVVNQPQLQQDERKLEKALKHGEKKLDEGAKKFEEKTENSAPPAPAP
jgi:hypothetical protein